MIKPKHFIPSLWFIPTILLMLSSCGKDSMSLTDNALVPPILKSSATLSSLVPAVFSRSWAKQPEVSMGHGTDKLILTTEELGPFNYTDPQTKKVIGIAIEIVEELMKKAQVNYQVQMMPWARAYKQALEDPNVCAFATYKTPERTPLFKWVGPLLVAKWSFYALSDSNIVIHSIDDARKYTIGGYLADAPTGYLEGQGLVLDKVADNNLNPKKLQSGRIQLWATGDPAGPFMANLLGVKNIKSVYTFYKVEMGISCNQGVSDELIAKLQAALNSVEEEGIAEKIRQKYSTSLRW